MTRNSRDSPRKDAPSLPSSMSSSLSSVPTRSPYRGTREMPYRLRQAVNVYLDNKQYNQGFSFLHSIIVAGTSNLNAPGAYLPLPDVFELAATVAVHPNFTTRARSFEEVRSSGEALRVLKDTCTIIGPINAGFNSAFSFRIPGVVRRRKRKRGDGLGEHQHGEDGSGIGSEEGSEDEGTGRLKSAYAKEKSVFRQRGTEVGFWSVVGWALNCSVRHRKRWEYWRPWLEVMVEILEEDLGSRFQAANEAVEAGADRGAEIDKMAKEALLARYCEGFGTARGHWKRAVRAILAVGSDESMREFGEVWKNETKRRKKEDENEWEREKRKKVDLENDEWGDFAIKVEEDEFEDEDEDEKIDDASSNAEQESGGPDAMRIRQRLLIQLLELLNLTNALPGRFIYIEDLYDIYTECLKPLPLPYFRDFFAMLGPMEGAYPTLNHIALLVNTILPFLAAPPNRPDIIGVTQAQLIKSYLPHGANATSVTENVKMSLLIEHLLFYMWSAERLEPNTALTNAIEKGIKARKTRAIGDARKKDKLNNADEQAARVALDLSAGRIRMLVDMMNASGIGAYACVDVEEGMGSSSQLSDITATPSMESEKEDEVMTPT